MTHELGRAASALGSLCFLESPGQEGLQDLEMPIMVFVILEGSAGHSGWGQARPGAS